MAQLVNTVWENGLWADTVWANGVWGLTGDTPAAEQTFTSQGHGTTWNPDWYRDKPTKKKAKKRAKIIARTVPKEEPAPEPFKPTLAPTLLPDFQLGELVEDASALRSVILAHQLAMDDDDIEILLLVS